MHNKAYYKYVEEDAGAQAKSYEKYNTGAKGDKGAKGAKARGHVSLPCAIENRFVVIPAHARVGVCTRTGSEGASGRQGGGRQGRRKGVREDERRRGLEQGDRLPLDIAGQRGQGRSQDPPSSAAAVRSPDRESHRGCRIPEARRSGSGGGGAAFRSERPLRTAQVDEHSARHSHWI